MALARSSRPSSVPARPSIALRLSWLLGAVVLAQHVVFVAVAGGSAWRSLFALLASVLAGLVGGMWLSHAREGLRAFGRRLRAIEGGGEPGSQAIARAKLGPLAQPLRAIGARIEAHRALSAKAREASEYKSAFLRSVRHELRTPLNSILGFSDVLLGGLEGPLSEDQRESLTVIRRSAARLSQMFEEVVELTLLAADQGPRKQLELDLHELIESVADALEGVRGDRPVHIKRALPQSDSFLPAPPKRVVLGDAERLHKLLLAVASHALEHAAGHMLVVSLQPEGAHEVLQVCDPSRVLSEDELLVLRGQPSNARGRRKGLGEDARLLIALCERVASEHGGHARVDSNAEEGTCIALHLPVVAS